MTINTSTTFVERKLTSPRRRVSNFDAPLYNRSFQFRHDTDRHTFAYARIYSTTRASATVLQLMSTCVQTETTINTSTSFVEWKSTLPRRSVSNFDSSPYNQLWAFAFKSETRILVSFVERKSTSPWRSISNFDADSKTHDWDREGTYVKQQGSSWLDLYFRYSSSMQYRSRYNRTVCHIRRSGWLEVMTVEADSTINYRV